MENAAGERKRQGLRKFTSLDVRHSCRGRAGAECSRRSSGGPVQFGNNGRGCEDGDEGQVPTLVTGGIQNVPKV